jgi:hypothetical protein
LFANGIAAICRQSYSVSHFRMAQLPELFMEFVPPRVTAGAYLMELVGTIGADPFDIQMPSAKQMP